MPAEVCSQMLTVSLALAVPVPVQLILWVLFTIHDGESTPNAVSRNGPAD
jgi:hypothetical protein